VPEELAQRASVHRWVPHEPTSATDLDRSELGLSDQYAPPGRQQRLNSIPVLLGDHDGRIVEYTAVLGNLTRQPIKRVRPRFDFEPIKGAVHRGHIDADQALSDTELVRDYGRRIAPELARKKRVQPCPDISVAHATRLVLCFHL